MLKLKQYVETIKAYALGFKYQWIIISEIFKQVRAVRKTEDIKNPLHTILYTQGNIAFIKNNALSSEFAAVLGRSTAPKIFKKTPYEYVVAFHDRVLTEDCDDLREFLVEHELAHIHCGHGNIKSNKAMENRIMREFNILNSILSDIEIEVQPTELEADAVAAKQVGVEKAINSLTQLGDICYDITGIRNPEIAKRIEALSA